MRPDSYGEDGIYFDHRDDCRDSAHHKTCNGRWRGVVSLGYAECAPLPSQTE